MSLLAKVMTNLLHSGQCVQINTQHTGATNLFETDVCLNYFTFTEPLLLRFR